MKSYSGRAQSQVNPTARALLELMDRKKTNLSIAADVVDKQDLLEMADVLGPYICVLKTHIDILVDFDESVIHQLTDLATKHDFLIFEDRKFADIGNTVKYQYSAGIYKIASWSHITNAHPIPGDGIVSGLAEVGLPLGRGLLLLAEMSSAGTLAAGSYTDATLAMARRHKQFVFGFIGQRRLEEENDVDDFVYMTPGVNMSVTGDKLGQQYRTPEQVILDAHCDVIIVGRGVYGSGGGEKGGLASPNTMVANAIKYRDAGWNAYLKRCDQVK